MSAINNELSPNLNQKCPSYLVMVIQAILSSPEKKMLLQEIYAYIRANYNYVITQHVSWQNSVRHNLSTHGCFFRMRNLNRGASFWGIHPQFIPYFEKGDFSRRWATGPKRKQETPAMFNVQYPEQFNIGTPRMNQYYNNEYLNSLMQRTDLFSNNFLNYYMTNPPQSYSPTPTTNVQTLMVGVQNPETTSTTAQSHTYYIPNQTSTNACSYNYMP